MTGRTCQVWPRIAPSPGEREIMGAKEGTKNGIVAAGHPLTAGAADEILRAGGNAFDAALAALVTACATEPVMASPAAAGFLLALPVEGKPRVYDFFAQTPALRRAESEVEFNSILADLGAAPREFHTGKGPVAVPGLGNGFFAAPGALAPLPLAVALASARPFKGLNDGGDGSQDAHQAGFRKTSSA